MPTNMTVRIGVNCECNLLSYIYEIYGVNMNEEVKIPKENKMGTMPVLKLILNMSLPMMASMLIQALYNIVDSYFVAKLDGNAMTALGLCFPIQMLIMAFGNGMAIGVNALVSKSLGEKKFERADKIAMNGVFLAAVNAVVFLAAGLLLVKPYFSVIKINESDINIVNSIKQYGIDYLTINCACAFAIYLQIIFERLLQSTGKTIFSMITQGVGAIVNIILDPIMIFGLAGCPAMGVKGAAIATVIGQLTAGTLGIIFNLWFNKELHLKIKNILPKWEIIVNIYKIGIPSIIMMSIGSVMNIGINAVLLSFSAQACEVFTAYYKLQSFFFMPVFGLNGSVVPIIGYNFGAGKKKRLLKTIKISVIIAEILMVTGTIVFEIMPETLIRIFDPAIVDIGVPALRVIAIHFPIAAVCIILGTVFQALGHGMYSTWVSIARQLVVLLPAAYLLSLSGNLTLVWLAFPIAEIASLTMTMIFYRNVYKKTIVNVADNE